MSEFMEKHSVSKLIGSPPGYVGYEEGGQLTERVKRAPYSVVLLDEIEKAHPDVFNILLQVFEDGQLTDGLGNTVDFKNTILIMTSNIGARHLQRREGLGFQSSKEDMISEKVEDLVKNEVKRTFNPEFLNRLDEIILFSALSEGDLIQILELMVSQLNQNLAQKAITVTVTDEAKKWILSQTLVDRSYGARPLRRALQKYIEDPLSEALIQGTIQLAPHSSKSSWATTNCSTAQWTQRKPKACCCTRTARKAAFSYQPSAKSWRLLFLIRAPHPGDAQISLAFFCVVIETRAIVRILVQSYKLILSIASIFVLAGCLIPLDAQTPDPHQVPIMDGEAGPCSVAFTVTDIKGTPVYDARIRVHIAYGFAGGRKLDLEAATNVDGKTQFKGLPEKVKSATLIFAPRKTSETARQSTIPRRIAMANRAPLF